MSTSLDERELLFQQKYLYQFQTVNTLLGLNTLLLYVYYICIVIVLYFLFTKYEYNVYIKGFLSILLIAYPFIVYFIETFVYRTSQYIGAFITGHAYD